MDIPNIENNVRFVELADLEKEMAAGDELEELDVKQDTMAVLGGEYYIAGVQAKPPSVGMLAMLSSIDSPFVLDDTEARVTINEVLKALYVICLGKDAVQPIYAAVKAEQLLKRAENLATKSPEYFAVYTNALERLADKWVVFDSAVNDFAEQLGVINAFETAEEINNYLGCCFGGFNMVPGDDEGAKKKDSTQIG